MAMTDYFYPCHKLESKVTLDGIGGFLTVEYLGVEFQGLAVRGNLSEQVVGAIKGVQSGVYNFYTFADVPLKKDDKVAYDENGTMQFLRLTTNGQQNPAQSGQTEWVSFQAELYTPTRLLGE